MSDVASCAIRVLSPRIEPPVRVDDGSTASTATLWPWAVRKVPSVSMVVDLPTPGAPVMPTRIALPVCGSSSCTSWCACCLMVGALALDQRDGARQRRAVAGAEFLGKGFGVGGLVSCHPCFRRIPSRTGRTNAAFDE